jgi:iron complex transport system ATP-binding protein
MVRASREMAGVGAKPNLAIAFAHVTFAYPGSRVAVLGDVSLHVAAGEMVALLGPNGAGKSTLLKLVSGILAPTVGSVRLEGVPVRTLRHDEIARRVAVLPQDFAVQFAYTVRQIVELGRMPHTGIWGMQRSRDRAAVQRALEATETAELADRVYNELSGGERQRALLALALAQDANILLLDEPTAHLDIRHQVETLELLRRLNRERGLTVLAALHDLNLAARFFSRIVLCKREIVADGPPAAVLDAEVLARVYETAVHVGILRGEQYLSVLPPSRTGDDDGQERPHARVRVHVLAGGGSGEVLMRALADTGIPFSAGPLNVGDSDQALAARLATECVTEPPFAAVSADGLEAARRLMWDAEVTIVCPAELGPGNIGLLEAALEGRRAGRAVVLLDVAGEEGDRLARVRARDFSGRGEELYRALESAGAEWAETVGETVAAAHSFL